MDDLRSEFELHGTISLPPLLTSSRPSTSKTTDLNTCVAYLERCDCVDSSESTKPWEVVFWDLHSHSECARFECCALIGCFWEPCYVLDTFVVGTTLSSEIFLGTDTIGLLVILTLWWIVMVAHGIFEVTDEAWEKESSKKRLADAEFEHDDDQQLLREKDPRIAELERTLELGY
ncbi:unnamed protein product [Calypogeia fissa]